MSELSLVQRRACDEAVKCLLLAERCCSNLKSLFRQKYPWTCSAVLLLPKRVSFPLSTVIELEQWTYVSTGKYSVYSGSLHSAIFWAFPAALEIHLCYFADICRVTIKLNLTAIVNGILLYGINNLQSLELPELGLVASRKKWNADKLCLTVADGLKELGSHFHVEKARLNTFFPKNYFDFVIWLKEKIQ